MERERRHEELYERTIDTFIASVARESFSEEAVPRLVHDLRQELGQCLELGLIGAPFYRLHMEKLQEVVGAIY